MISQPKLLLRYSNKIIVHGNRLKNDLLKRSISADKILAIPHFDYNYLLHNIDEDCDCGEDDDDKYMLFFGNIKPYKGLDVFLNALDVVEKKINSSRLKVMIAGKGSLHPYESLLVGKKRDYLIVKNENIPNSGIPCLFKKASVIVLPYTDASQSGVVPLAYTFSRPVIVSNIESLKEYVEHGITGFVFESKNIEQLAGYLIDAISHPDLMVQMGVNAHRKLNNEMTLDICSSQINAIYKEITQDKQM
jgi:glycosyltransferase involved in cell wall biosynthesis